MSIDKGTFEALVPSRFITFTFPYPSSSHFHNPPAAAALPTPLIRVAVLDSPTQPITNPPRIAAMLVPTRRESDWIFSTETGHLHLLLLHSPHISRLILIGNLPSDPHATPLDEECLMPLLFALSPKSSFKNGFPEIPFLNYEDDVIRSVVLEKCVGSCVGEMLVEDVELESAGKREFRRRLRFKRMPNLIQTQIRIVPSNSSSDGGFVSSGDLVSFGLDMGTLVHPYLAPMVAGLSLISACLEERIRGGIRPKALCLGVGGGALLTFLDHQLGFEVFGVEEDEVVLKVARKYFGLGDCERIRVCVGDGLKLLEQIAGQGGDFCVNNGCCVDNVNGLEAKFDVIMVDLDSSDAGMGAMAPPFKFVEKSVILAARLRLSEHGVLVINVIPPSSSFYEELVRVFREFFQELYGVDVGNGENFVLIATASPIGTASSDSENSFLAKLKLVIKGEYLDSISKI